MGSWARKVSKSTTVRKGLQRCGSIPKSEEDFAVDWAMSGEDANGEQAQKESLVSFDPDESYEWWVPDDRFVIDQHPRGFARLIDGMVRESVPDGDPRVVLNAHVEHIHWGCDGVVASAKDGRTFKGKHAITTVSL